MKTNKLPVAKTRLQIAEEYDFSYATLWRKLKENGLQLSKGLLPPKCQKKIYDSLGYPAGVKPEDYKESI